MDFLISIGMRPFVELSFMPEMLASGSTRVFSYQANVTPPKNYRQWEELIHKLASHWVERYGVDEVREWFFEVWNEPNLKAFWTGTQKDYFKLYRITAKALKRVDPLLKVGGPATAKNAWVPEFLEFCENRKVPVDFVSTHHYPTDAFGKAGADTLSQLQHAPPHVMRDDVRTVRRSGERLAGLLHRVEYLLESRAMRFTMSRSPQPTRPRLFSKLEDWSKATASGPSATSSMRITFLRSLFKVDSVC